MPNQDNQPQSQGIVERYRKSTDKVRGNAKWLLGAFGGIGSVLIASSSLTNTGNLTLDNPRLWIAAVAGLVALIAVGVILWFGLRVLISESKSFPALVEEEKEHRLSRGVKSERSKELELVYENKYALFPDGCQTLQEWAEKYEASSGQDYDDYLYMVEQLNVFVRYKYVQGLFNTAKVVAFACGGLAAIAVVIVVWAANPPS